MTGPLLVSPGASGASVTFDLPPELALTPTSGRSRIVPTAAVVAFGVFLLFFGVLAGASRTPAGIVVAIVLVLAALALFVLAARSGRPAPVPGPSVLTVDTQGVRFVPAGGPSVGADWNDPSLKVDLREFTGDRDQVLPVGDPRRSFPQWVSFFVTPRRVPRAETPVPPEALAAIRQAAEQYGVTVRPVDVGFYWYRVARGPGFLAYEVAGDIQRAKQVNGKITRLRGSAWSAYPDE